jgi:hypothetical protein
VCRTDIGLAMLEMASKKSCQVAIATEDFFGKSANLP